MRRAILVLLLAVPAHADAPLPAPAKRTIRSPNKRFFAVMDPDKKWTTVYRTAPDGRATEVWGMRGWFRVAHLADDGEHLVAGSDGMDLLPIDHEKDQVMITFFGRGERIKDIPLDRLIRDPSQLRRTASHYYWGNYLGFDRAGRYVVETVEGRRLRFDVKTGEVVGD
jgi:hypothetical protein